MPILIEISSGWQKQATNICYGAKGDQPAKFVMKKEGLLIGVKLVHRSGYVSCLDANPSYASRWGCHTTDIHTLITTTKKRVIFQENTKYQIGIDGKTSNELVFIDVEYPMYVNVGMELQIWYREDLHNGGEIDNGGKHCIDVYTEVVSPLKLHGRK